LFPTRTRGTGRLLVAFFFGLFHGLGFAGGLLSAMQGMQTTAVAIAIVAFSIGVELGHQVVVLPVFALRQLSGRWAGRTPATTDRVLRVGSFAIGLAGLFYLAVAVSAGFRR
jgi:ABC-type nickel/cobalt efflux system permease component RcnA